MKAELDKGMLISGLAFLALHHKSGRDEAARDAVNECFTERMRNSCRRVEAHHQEQLYQVGEQIALLGGRNAYPRPTPEPPVSAPTEKERES